VKYSKDNVDSKYTLFTSPIWPDIVVIICATTDRRICPEPDIALAPLCFIYCLASHSRSRPHHKQTNKSDYSIVVRCHGVASNESVCSGNDDAVRSESDDGTSSIEFFGALHMRSKSAAVLNAEAFKNLLLSQTLETKLHRL
jgi:hypothetical protein